MSAVNPNIVHTMTRYEKAKLLGVRIEQLARGGIPCVSLDDVKKHYGEVTVRTIALYELDTKTMPLKIKRNDTDEYMSIDKLILI